VHTEVPIVRSTRGGTTSFVPDQLSPWRTLLSQLAASFATLVAQPSLGAVAVNLRYLRRAGLNPALTASVLVFGGQTAFAAVAFVAATAPVRR
jgi:hypothetical protein